MKKLIILLFIIPNLCFASQPKVPEYITGDVTYVYDGDTIQLDNDTIIRFKGIDTPESNQLCKDKNNKYYKCGQQAKEFLTKGIDKKTLTCNILYKDKYDRSVAVCKDNLEQDINYIMVRTGNAVAANYYGENPYAEAEKQAKITKLGIWGGDFTNPYQWRMKYNNKDKDKFYF
jgi:endonuclease YncB( thermonuclease family)